MKFYTVLQEINKQKAKLFWLKQWWRAWGFVWTMFLLP